MNSQTPHLPMQVRMPRAAHGRRPSGSNQQHQKSEREICSERSASNLDQQQVAQLELGLARAVHGFEPHWPHPVTYTHGSPSPTGPPHSRTSAGWRLCWRSTGAIRRAYSIAERKRTGTAHSNKQSRATLPALWGRLPGEDANTSGEGLAGLPGAARLIARLIGYNINQGRESRCCIWRRLSP